MAQLGATQGLSLTHWLELEFPGLADSSYTVESPYDVRYNCIAFACENSSRWWWPDAMNQKFWPEGVPREVTVSAFVRMLKMRGFEAGGDPSAEDGVQKVALFVDSSGTPTHMARQLSTGCQWRT